MENCPNDMKPSENVSTEVDKRRQKKYFFEIGGTDIFKMISIFENGLQIDKGLKKV